MSNFVTPKVKNLGRFSFDISLAQNDKPTQVSKCSHFDLFSFTRLKIALYSIKSRVQAGQKTTKSALAAALKATAYQDLEPRSKTCLGGPFLKKKTF